jgi:hypothetical protein
VQWRILRRSSDTEIVVRIFWSWQSDTPGKTGRHFVRGALTAAIAILKESADVEEPTQREERDSLTLDHDRKGVSGSPDLAATILRKIAQAKVFVADVTLVGAVDANAGVEKRLINSNVAIEYGYAHHALGEEAILMVQNVHYGSREALPFDLRHKAGPITFDLSPDANKTQIAATRSALARDLVAALKPYLEKAAPAAGFLAMPATTAPAYYWPPGEILVTTRQPGQREDDDGHDYVFADPHAFYARLYPAAAQPLLGVAELNARVGQRRPQILEQTPSGGLLGRNRYGVIHYSPHGPTSAHLRAFTQAFRSREIWGVSRDFMVQFEGGLVIPMEKMRKIFSRVLGDYVAFAADVLELPPPFSVELGAIGLRDVRVSHPAPNPYNETAGPIHDASCMVRRVIHSAAKQTQDTVVEAFVTELYDLAGVAR